MKQRVLIIDDREDQCELLKLLVRRLEYGVVATTSPEEALEHAKRESFDAILTDLRMGGMTGVELCAGILAVDPEVPVILVTAEGCMASAVAAMRAGAYDFLAKPVDINALGLALKRACERRRLRSELKVLRESSVDAGPGRLIGNSAPMQRLRELIDRVGPSSDTSVLIEGETGTGKELVARAIHQASARKHGRFVAINCAAMPMTLLETELFGHARGAFTDAKNAREGLLVQASGGTLFLDEIGEMPLEMQAKLLRALQERTVRPVGANAEVAFDTRIVSATHRNLENDSQARRFREDLYYRINVVNVRVPPLRGRGDDVLLLASYFLKRSCKRSKREEPALSPHVASLLLAYRWPGNVRELENCMERAVALARLNVIDPDDLPERVKSSSGRSSARADDDTGEIVSLEAHARDYILRALENHDGNCAHVASLLKLDRRTLQRRLAGYEGAAGIGTE